MAKKSKQSDLGAPNKAPPPSAPTPGRQPRIVGWLVIIVGCVSTWYWYKPLPDSVQQTVHSTNANSWVTSDSGPKSLWSDQGLVVPGTSGVFENPIEFQAGDSNAQPAEANLVGTPKVTLVPWSETQHDIREVLRTERQQANATHRQESIALSEPPRPLIPAANPPIGPLETSVAKPSWPDEGYVPPPKAKRRNQAQITAPIPPFLETGMKSIRTTESDDVPGPKGTIAPNAEPPSAPAPIRQPQFIRQPKN